MQVIILLLGIYQTLSLQVPPTWLTSPFVQAAQNDVLSTLTGSSSTPTATLTFPNAFISTPNLAFGIINYIGTFGFI